MSNSEQLPETEPSDIRMLRGFGTVALLGAAATVGSVMTGDCDAAYYEGFSAFCAGGIAGSFLLHYLWPFRLGKIDAIPPSAE